MTVQIENRLLASNAARAIAFLEAFESENKNNEEIFAGLEEWEGVPAHCEDKISVGSQGQANQEIAQRDSEIELNLALIQQLEQQMYERFARSAENAI